MKLPPFAFLVFESEQPNPETWAKFLHFAREWNEKHTAQFTGDASKRKALFPGSMHDPEFPIIREELGRLEKETGVKYHALRSDDRPRSTRAQRPYVHFVSDGYYDECYANADTAIRLSNNCEQCGSRGPWSSNITEPLIFDESVLDADNEINEQYESGLDFINTPNGGLFVTQKVKRILESHNVTGYRLLPVINKATGKTSDRLFLLVATRIVVDPCHEHTVRDKDAICPHCGGENGTVYGNFYIQQSQLEGDEIFSINRFGVSQLYFSQRVFLEFKKEGLESLTVSNGIDICTHDGEPIPGKPYKGLRLA